MRFIDLDFFLEERKSLASVYSFLLLGLARPLSSFARLPYIKTLYRRYSGVDDVSDLEKEFDATRWSEKSCYSSLSNENPASPIYFQPKVSSLVHHAGQTSQRNNWVDDKKSFLSENPVDY